MDMVLDPEHFGTVPNGTEVFVRGAPERYRHIADEFYGTHRQCPVETPPNCQTVWITVTSDKDREFLAHLHANGFALSVDDGTGVTYMVSDLLTMEQGDAQACLIGLGPLHINRVFELVTCRLNTSSVSESVRARLRKLLDLIVIAEVDLALSNEGPCELSDNTGERSRADDLLQEIRGATQAVLNAIDQQQPPEVVRGEAKRAAIAFLGLDSRMSAGEWPVPQAWQ